MTLRASPKEIQRRDELFFDFCKLVCPDYSDKRNRLTLVKIAGTLKNVHGILEVLHSQAQEFRQKFPDGVEVKDEMPIKPKPCDNKDICRYKKEAIQLVEKATGMELPMDYSIPSTFYEGVIDGSIIFI